jgi:hypothetical protein
MHIQNLFEQKKRKKLPIGPNWLGPSGRCSQAWANRSRARDHSFRTRIERALALQAIGPVEEARPMKQVVLAWDDFSRYCFVLSAVLCMRTRCGVFKLVNFFSKFRYGTKNSSGLNSLACGRWHLHHWKLPRQIVLVHRRECMCRNEWAS